MAKKTVDLNLLALTIAGDPELAAMLPEGDGPDDERAIALYEEAFVRVGAAQTWPGIGHRMRGAFKADHDRIDYRPDAVADLNRECLGLGLGESEPAAGKAITAVRLLCLALLACERRERRAVPKSALERVTLLPDQDIVPIDWPEARLAQRPLPRPLSASLLEKIAAVGRKMAGLR